MIAKLTGVLDTSGEGWAVIDVNGVGYLIFCSNRTLGVLAGVTGAVSVFVETHVREDHIHLYGFADEGEREGFKLLTTVQGVGAKVALGILSALTVDALAQAVAAGDKAAVSQAQGVGPKLATRIVTELKDKVGGIALGTAALRANAQGAVPAGEGGENAAAADAVSALVNLGYGRTEAFGAVARSVQRLGSDAGLDSLIRDGLGELGSAETHA
ncbi:MAG: Holliday junction branch migration protein RuvA [Rhodospirillaceae bacterium]|jgi:Holliday junction DNA helicase RuvA|nr:Holliday junction branch migration protein RuvA [Rhodospirillaceae bacterium]MBT3883200.1 Holliday junction branch migration protein RuvA [Rhodospirillaceae bacterium]MBT4118691.1 Holliday junction branch migration protein RuvA [Rhodospirillaceae bacterium]MBT4674181.1 Holliday junction branch migration protein RuvA [Rhodospirillaceae bacterium]MBT4751978.1 Holliday junction branch migration protein RuvA [Rhodospirillaceae bacterium]